MTKKRIREILKTNLVLPVLKLRETHPEHYVTEKGFNALLDNATNEIVALFKEVVKKEIIHGK